MGSMGMATNGGATNSSDCAVNLSTPSDSPAKVNPFNTNGASYAHNNHNNSNCNSAGDFYGKGVNNGREQAAPNVSQGIEINVTDLLLDNNNSFGR